MNSNVKIKSCSQDVQTDIILLAVITFLFILTNLIHITMNSSKFLPTADSLLFGHLRIKICIVCRGSTSSTTILQSTKILQVVFYFQYKNIALDINTV